MTTKDDRQSNRAEGYETAETPPTAEKTLPLPDEIWCEMIFAPPGSGKSVLFPTVCGLEKKLPH